MRDEAQTNRIIEKYGDAVRRVCFLYLKSEHDVEDVFQEVFLKYILYPNEFESEEHLKAWLIRISINKCKDNLKSFFRKNVSSLEDVDTSGLEIDPEYREVYEAVLSLPSNYKSVVYLSYYEGYTAGEISQLMNKKENTIYTWLSRARKLLKEKLGGD